MHLPIEIIELILSKTNDILLFFELLELSNYFPRKIAKKYNYLARQIFYLAINEDNLNLLIYWSSLRIQLPWNDSAKSYPIVKYLYEVHNLRPTMGSSSRIW